MRFLCLHGAGTNADILRTQLAPLIYELEKDKTMSFHFVNGPQTTQAYPGIEAEFPGPFFRYLDDEFLDVAQLGRVAEKVSVTAKSPEDFMKKMVETGLVRIDPTAACNFLGRVMKSELDEPYDGVLGFCEGACVAAATLLRQAQTQGLAAFKCAIFICGFPVFNSETISMSLETKSAQAITIPTGHIMGSSDPCRPASMALHNTCRSDCASLYEHEKGHTIPWDKETVAAMAKVVQQTVDRAVKSE